MQTAQQRGGGPQASSSAHQAAGGQLMTPRESHAAELQRMMLDCKRQMNEAADSGNLREINRLADQYASLSRLLEAAS